MVKQKQVELLTKDKEKLYVTVDGFTIDKINELLLTGDFNSVSALVRAAILNLYKDYESKGKLKPKKPPETADERIKNAILTGSREVDVE